MPLPRPDLQLPQIPSPGVSLQPVAESDSALILVGTGLTLQLGTVTRPDLLTPFLTATSTTAPISLTSVAEVDSIALLVVFGPHHIAPGTAVEADHAAPLSVSGVLAVPGGKFVWKNIGLTIASTQITVASDVQVVSEVEAIDVTSYADVSGYREYACQYYDTRFEVELLSDRGSIDQLIRDTYVNGTLVPVAITPRPGLAGPLNPVWGGDCFIFHYETISGGPGDPSKVRITLKPLDDDLQLGTPYALQ